nr:venom lipolysis activating peptide beta subunit isoform X3 [Androctonus crassicauda]
MANMQVIFIAFIAVIAFSMVYGDSIYPVAVSGFYYGCMRSSEDFCKNVCKLHLGRGRGQCSQPFPFVNICECFVMDSDNRSFLDAMAKQCPKLNEAPKDLYFSMPFNNL